jgi:hypothetical protein
MTERKAFDYNHMFSVLKNHAVRLKLVFQPTRVTTDFEVTLISVVNAEVIFFLSELSEIQFLFLSLFSSQMLTTNVATFTIHRPSIAEFRHLGLPQSTIMTWKLVLLLES